MLQSHYCSFEFVLFARTQIHLISPQFSFLRNTPYLFPIGFHHLSLRSPVYITTNKPHYPIKQPKVPYLFIMPFRRYHLTDFLPPDNRFASNITFEDACAHVRNCCFYSNIERDFSIIPPNSPKIPKYPFDHLTHDEIFSHKPIIFNAIQTNGLLLEHASSDLQNDKDIVLRAISSHVYAWFFASSTLKKDPEVQKQTTTTLTELIAYFGPRGIAKVRNDLPFYNNVAIPHVKRYPRGIQWSNPATQLNRQVIIAAMSKGLIQLDQNYTKPFFSNRFPTMKSFIDEIFIRGFNNQHEILIMLERNVRLARGWPNHDAEYHYNLLDLTTYRHNDVVICTNRRTELEHLYELIRLQPEALVSHINDDE